MLGGLTIKAANSWSGYKRSSAMMYVKEALYKNDKLFHNRLKILKQTPAVLVKATFNDLQALKISINRHIEDLDVLSRHLQSLLTVANEKFYKIKMILNNHHLVITILTKTFMAYTKVLRKSMEFYDTYSRAFKDLLSTLDALSNTRLTH